MNDLAEEIARINGYDEIEATLPKVTAGIGGITYEESINRMAREYYGRKRILTGYDILI